MVFIENGPRTFGLVGAEVQAIDVHVFDCFRVITQNAKVVDGVTIDRVAVDFFVVIEYAVAPERARADDVAVRQNVATESVSNARVKEAKAGQGRSTLSPSRQQTQ